MTTKFLALMRLIRADRPIGTYLLLWPTLTALWLAGDGHPSLKNIVIFSLGCWLMRSAGCAINDYADRNIDGKIQRTAQRPIVNGDISPKQALLTFAALTALAATLVLQTNINTVLWSLGAAATAAAYPFMKRFTHLPQVVLGVAFSFGIPMAFAAEQVPLTPSIVIFWLANVLWVLMYDTFYAMADRDDDLKIGVKSTAVLFAQYDRSITGILQIVCIILLQYVFWQLAIGPLPFIGITVVAGCFLYQQYLIKDRQSAACLQAFFNNHIALFSLFCSVVLALSVSH